MLIAWENEAYLLEKEFGAKFDVVVPSLSILAEPAVTVVDKNVDKKGTRAVSQAYLEYLYSDEGQDIAGKNFYRPTSPKAHAKYAKQFPKLNLVTIDKSFGGVKQSGYGRIHGPEGLREFAYTRAIVATRFNIPLVFTTFHRKVFVDKFIKKFIQILNR